MKHFFNYSPKHPHLFGNGFRTTDQSINKGIHQSNEHIQRYQARDTGENMPTSTLVGVQALALSQFLVEIEAIAVIEKD